ncbi:hypothetical protein, partial [Martelella alba]
MPTIQSLPLTQPAKLSSPLGGKVKHLASALIKKLKSAGNIHQGVRTPAVKTNERRQDRAREGQKTTGRQGNHAASPGGMTDAVISGGESTPSSPAETEGPSENNRISVDDCRRDVERDMRDRLFSAAGRHEQTLRRLYAETDNQLARSRLDHIATTYYLAMDGAASGEIVGELNAIMTELTNKMVADTLGRKSVFGSHQPGRDKEYRKIRTLENRLAAIMIEVIGPADDAKAAGEAGRAAEHLLASRIKPFIVGYLEQQFGSRLTENTKANILLVVDRHAMRLLEQVRGGIESYQTGSLENIYRAVDVVLTIPHLLSDYDIDGGTRPAANRTAVADDVAPSRASIQAPGDDGPNAVPTDGPPFTRANGPAPAGERPSADRANNTYITNNNFVFSPTQNTFAPVNHSTFIHFDGRHGNAAPAAGTPRPFGDTLLSDPVAPRGNFPPSPAAAKDGLSKANPDAFSPQFAASSVFESAQLHTPEVKYAHRVKNELQLARGVETGMRPAVGGTTDFRGENASGEAHAGAKGVRVNNARTILSNEGLRRAGREGKHSPNI